ncbi:MAG TPA: hypothetical protein DDW27_01440 [Bacteroidales bacterium]|nr:hypothetical protein [Bacteroidales bacterium]
MCCKIPREAQKLCPAGWHVPAQTDWEELITSCSLVCSSS